VFVQVAVAILVSPWQEKLPPYILAKIFQYVIEDRDTHPCFEVAVHDPPAGPDHGLQREFIDRLFRQYLTPRERRILSLYYGLEEGSEALTLEGIGGMLGVTRERVRQIRERAFEKLRNSPDVKHLEGFWVAA